MLQLVEAYETPKDEGRRREYDLIYPSASRSNADAQSTQKPCPPATSAPRSEALREATQIAAIRKNKEERGARWRLSRRAFELSISELQRSISRLEQDIENLASIAAAEVGVEAHKNSWGAWLLSPFYKQADESEDEKARKDRQRQERRIEKDLKERRLGLHQAQLREKEILLQQAKKEIDAANTCDDQTIRDIEAKASHRETRERLEKEMAERERLARIFKRQQEEREKQTQEAKEASSRQRAEARAAQSAQQKEHRRRQRAFVDETAQHRTMHSSTVKTAALLRLTRRLAVTAAGGTKCKLVQPVQSATMCGTICCSAQAVEQRHIRNVNDGCDRSSRAIEQGQIEGNLSHLNPKTHTLRLM